MKKLKTYTALIVDDDANFLKEMLEFLGMLFLKIYSAVNAKRALVLAREHKIDVLFTDIQMPHIDGFELISQIKAENENMLMIVISAYDDKEKLFKAIKLDILDYIVKPLSSKKLKYSLELCAKKLQEKDMDICFGDDLRWEPKKQILSKGKTLINFTPSETKLFGLLIKNINKPIKSEDIFYHLWLDTEKIYSSKNVRNIIFGLRKKLKQSAVIKNIYGGKYMLLSEV